MRCLQLVAFAATLLLWPTYAAPYQSTGNKRTAIVGRLHDQCGSTVYTIITPKPGMKPTAVTRHFQPVHSCIPEYVVCDSKDKAKCETIYSTTSYRWISTEVPCYSGVATVTRVDEPITIAAYPTNRIETCRCDKSGPCYLGEATINVPGPTSFPYVNSGWNYHVCSYTDYYRWYADDYSEDFSGWNGPSGRFGGKAISYGASTKSNGDHQGPYNSAQSSDNPGSAESIQGTNGFPSGSYEGFSGGDAQIPDSSVGTSLSHSGDGITYHDQHNGYKAGMGPYEGVTEANNGAYRPDTGKSGWRAWWDWWNKSGSSSTSDSYSMDQWGKGYTSNAGWGNGWRSLQVQCRSCINGVCDTYPLGLITKTYIEIQTYEVPYSINRYFPQPTTLCIKDLGITITISVATSIKTVVTGTTTVTTTCTTTETTTVSTSVIVPSLSTTTTPSNPSGRCFILGSNAQVNIPSSNSPNTRSFFVCGNNRCSLQDTCRGAQILCINSLSQLTLDTNRNVVAYASRGNINSGSGPFQFGSGDVTTSFSLSGDALVWASPEFPDYHQVTFCQNTDDTISVVYANGGQPAGCQSIDLFRVDVNEEEGCIAATSSSSFSLTTSVNSVASGSTSIPLTTDSFSIAQIVSTSAAVTTDLSTTSVESTLLPSTTGSGPFSSRPTTNESVSLSGTSTHSDSGSTTAGIVILSATASAPTTTGGASSSNSMITTGSESSNGVPTTQSTTGSEVSSVVTTNSISTSFGGSGTSSAGPSASATTTNSITISALIATSDVYSSQSTGISVSVSDSSVVVASNTQSLSYEASSGTASTTFAVTMLVSSSVYITGAPTVVPYTTPAGIYSSEPLYSALPSIPVNVNLVTDFCDTLEGVNLYGTCKGATEVDLCDITNILTGEDLKKCKASGGKVPTNLLGCLTEDGGVNVECITSCRKTLDTVPLAQQCLQHSGTVHTPAIKCAHMGLSGGSDILYKACVTLMGESPCKPQNIRDQVIEDVTTYLTECAAAGLLEGGVRTCVDRVRLNADHGSGVASGVLNGPGSGDGKPPYYNPASGSNPNYVSPRGLLGSIGSKPDGGLGTKLGGTLTGTGLTDGLAGSLGGPTSGDHFIAKQSIPKTKTGLQGLEDCANQVISGSL